MTGGKYIPISAISENVFSPKSQDDIWKKDLNTQE